ncbi:MAG: ribulose-phosphate 3-epimerase [Oscillospiraceae bacterium]|nr:ribulose-phosphate 3-epimerase [Oscillospiraceae bacterium]
MAKIAPSLLAADFLNLSYEMDRLVGAGAEILHLDVMDGHFVPNITFGYELVAALARKNNTFGSKKMTLDVHLMMSNPLRYVDKFCAAGANILTVHAECGDDVAECLSRIERQRVTPGLSIKPATPAAALAPYIDKIGYCIVMTVEPGFGGQELMEDCLPKIGQIRGMAGGKDILIAADGGVNLKNCRRVADCGADILIAGSAVFGARDMKKALRELRARI